MRIMELILKKNKIFKNTSIMEVNLNIWKCSKSLVSFKPKIQSSRLGNAFLSTSCFNCNPAFSLKDSEFWQNLNINFLPKTPLLKNLAQIWSLTYKLSENIQIDYPKIKIEIKFKCLFNNFQYSIQHESNQYLVWLLIVFVLNKWIIKVFLEKPILLVLSTYFL